MEVALNNFNNNQTHEEDKLIQLKEMLFGKEMNELYSRMNQLEESILEIKNKTTIQHKELEERFTNFIDQIVNNVKSDFDSANHSILKLFEKAVSDIKVNLSEEVNECVSESSVEKKDFTYQVDQMKREINLKLSRTLSQTVMQLTQEGNKRSKDDQVMFSEIVNNKITKNMLQVENIKKYIIDNLQKTTMQLETKLKDTKNYFKNQIDQELKKVYIEIDYIKSKNKS